MANENSDVSLPTPEEYERFISGLKLEGVYLVESAAKSSMRTPPDGVQVDIDPGTDLEQIHYGRDDDGFTAFVDITARFIRDDEEIGRVTVSYAASYVTDKEATDGELTIFLAQNLHLHVWPYAREYIQNTLSRFGWQAYALPPLVSRNGED